MNLIVYNAREMGKTIVIHRMKKSMQNVFISILVISLFFNMFSNNFKVEKIYTATDRDNHDTTQRGNGFSGQP